MLMNLKKIMPLLDHASSEAQTVKTDVGCASLRLRNPKRWYSWNISTDTANFGNGCGVRKSGLAQSKTAIIRYPFGLSGIR